MRKATGSYRTYSFLVKLQTWVPEFAMEDLPLGRIAALVPEFAVKDLPLGRSLMMMIFVLGAKGDWDFRISDLVKSPDGTDI